jgi:hypothetical protein
LALAAAALLGVVGFLAFDEGALEAARRRVPPGAGREAIEAAVGRAADSLVAKVDRRGGAEARRRNASARSNSKARPLAGGDAVAV